MLNLIKIGRKKIVPILLQQAAVFCYFSNFKIYLSRTTRIHSHSQPIAIEQHPRFLYSSTNISNSQYNQSDQTQQPTKKPQEKTYQLKTICELMKIKYYDFNQEIDLPPNESVHIYDQFDNFIGEMTLQESFAKAFESKQDIVLRNKGTRPPIVKMMNYQKQIFKKLLVKLGKKFDQNQQRKPKAIMFSSNIKSHDLHNRIKNAQSLLKKHSILKIFLPVQAEDQESVAKGKLVLNKMITQLSPVSKARKQIQILQSVPQNIIKHSSKILTGHTQKEQDKYNKDNQAKKKVFIHVQLVSTVNQNQFDIDTILQTQTLDEFVRNLYMKDKIYDKDIQSSSKYAKRYLKQETNDLYNTINQNVSSQTQRSEQSLNFFDDVQQLTKQQTQKRMQQERLLTHQAIINLRKQKQQKSKSQIFGGGKTMLTPNSQTSKKKGKKGHKGGKKAKANYQQFMQSKHHDLTELTEQQKLLIQIEGNLQDAEEYEDEEILNARFEDLDIQTKRRYKKLQCDLIVEKMDLKLKALKRLVDSQEFKKEIEGQFQGQ